MQNSHSLLLSSNHYHSSNSSQHNCNELLATTLPKELRATHTNFTQQTNKQRKNLRPCYHQNQCNIQHKVARVASGEDPIQASEDELSWLARSSSFLSSPSSSSSSSSSTSLSSTSLSSSSSPSPFHHHSIISQQ